MSTLQKIEINNFRGFSHLDIDGLNQINLFIGKNNSGKSSILEAIFLLIGMSNPALPDNINKIRGLNIKNAEDFKYIFHKLEFRNSPEFTGFFSETDERSLKITPLLKKSSDQSLLTEQVSTNTATSSTQISGLNLEFSLKQRHTPRKSYKSFLEYNQPNITININNIYKEELHAVFISGYINDAGTLPRFSEIIKRKNSNLLITALKKIDPNIESIQALLDGIFFSYKDIEELIPSNITGDGIRKFLNILSAIAEKPNSIILIDEIENGLHYSAHKLLWESIISISKIFNTQLFITSHNIETLRHLKEVLDNTHPDFQQKLSVYTIANTAQKGIKTYKYSYEGFKEAIETETEIR